MARKRKTTKKRARSQRKAPVRGAPTGNATAGFVMNNDDIERALRTGEDAGVLEDYFGPSDYAELRRLSQQASAKRSAAGPRVLILPGITGSRLGHRPSDNRESVRGGVANYVGTYWPVGDTSAKLFAENFYKSLLRGETAGKALLAGRRAVWDEPSVDWADYIHYGSHDFVLKVR